MRRVYLELCPEGLPIEATSMGFAVECPLTATPLPLDEGQSDDHLRIDFDAGGSLIQETYLRAGKPTMTIHYEDVQPVRDLYMAHRIILRHTELPYSLRIVLLDVDLDFDARGTLAKAGS